MAGPTVENAITDSQRYADYLKDKRLKCMTFPGASLFLPDVATGPMYYVYMIQTAIRELIQLHLVQNPVMVWILRVTIYYKNVRLMYPNVCLTKIEHMTTFGRNVL